MTIQQLNAQSTRYVAQRHACASALYFITVKETGFLIDSAMSLKSAIAWMAANGNKGA